MPFIWNDHSPPHFHAKYSGDEAVIDINTGETLKGALSKRVLSLVEEWRRLHRDELMQDWELARQRKPLRYIFSSGVKIMIPHVTKAEYKEDYKIWLRFNDGSEGVVDLKDELYGEMFEPLRDINKFKSFQVDPELETLVWENGADFAPEFLRDHLFV